MRLMGPEGGRVDVVAAGVGVHEVSASPPGSANTNPPPSPSLYDIGDDDATPRQQWSPVHTVGGSGGGSRKPSRTRGHHGGSSGGGTFAGACGGEPRAPAGKRNSGAGDSTWGGGGSARNGNNKGGSSNISNIALNQQKPRVASPDSPVLRVDLERLDLSVLALGEEGGPTIPTDGRAGGGAAASSGCRNNIGELLHSRTFCSEPGGRPRSLGGRPSRAHALFVAPGKIGTGPASPPSSYSTHSESGGFASPTVRLASPFGLSSAGAGKGEHHHHQQQQQQQQQQQARFEKPRPASPAPAGSGEAGQTQQMVFAERLYDFLSHERLGAGGGAAASQQARFLSLAFGTEGRAAPPGFPHKQYQQHYQGAGLPSPFGSTATTASCSSSPSSSASSAAFSHLPPPQLQEQPCRRQDPSESEESTLRRGGEGEEGTATGGMVMSEQERQALLARPRSGPSAAAAAVAAVEQDRHALLARPRTGPAGYTRDDEHRYYQQQQDAGYMYDRSPDRSLLGRGGGFSFGSGRFGSGAPQGSGGGALPPLPSLNFEQYSVGGGGGGGGGPVGVGEIRRAPWYGPESSYAPPPIGSYVN